MGPDGHWLELLRYPGDSTSAAYRSSITSPDVTNLDSIGSIPVYSTAEGFPGATGKTTLLISGRFTNVTGATTLFVVKGSISTLGPGPTYTSTFRAIAIEPVSTAISATSCTIGGKHVSNEVIADLFGCTAAKILVTRVSTQDVDLWVRRV